MQNRHHRYGRLFLYLCLALSTRAAVVAQPHPVLDARLWNVDDSVTSLRHSAPATTKLRVVIFFSETCPICQKYCPGIRALEQKFAAKGVRFQLVFPDTATTVKDIKAFARKYKMTTPCFVDRRQELTTALNARMTPEAALINAEGDLLYMGRIDNFFAAPGKMRTSITERELESAISDALSGRLPVKRQESAVGCLIERIAK